MKEDIIEIVSKCVTEVTGKEATSDLDNLHINFDFDYKKSLSIQASGSIVDGPDTYTCEVIVKINKVTA
jgi:hypothetical protein